jgi:hypothetical protein
LATEVEVNINNSGLNNASVIVLETIESEGNLGLGQRCIILVTWFNQYSCLKVQNFAIISQL